MAVMKEQGPSNRPRVGYWNGNNTPLNRCWKAIKFRDEWARDRWAYPMESKQKGVRP